MRAAPRRESVFGRYELLCLLATGGMASVHLARAEGIGGFEKLLVIKRILPHAAKDRSFIQMFLDEARIAATLDHSNVAHVFDVGTAQGDVFLAMEFLHGHDVRSIVRSVEGPLPIDPTIAVAVGVCAGLHYAHEKRGPKGQLLGLVHRDVSPSNVVVTYDGSVKVIDFGIAKATSRPSETGSGVLKGKPGYMSPEQCLGEALDRRSDVFCVGIMLYELTTGTRLFGPKGAEYVQLRAIVEADIAPPSTLVPGYSADLERIVLRALRRRPEDRYQTALELQRALEAFALASRLDVSPTRLAKFMEETFRGALDAWREAEQSGVTLAEHVVASDQGRRASQNHRAAAGAATETESAESDADVNEYASTELLAADPSAPSRPGTKGAQASKVASRNGASTDRTPGEATTRIPVSTTYQPASRSVPVQRGGRVRRTALAVLALALAGSVGVAARYARPRHETIAAGPSTTPAPAPTPITSLPLPTSTNREALAAYAEGIQALRDAANGTALNKFQRATELDPMLAAAHLRAAMILEEWEDKLARASFERARGLRSLLSERDQGWLDAEEPTIAGVHSDAAESARRLLALSKRYPGDAEIALWLAVARGVAGDFVGATASAKDSLALDPDFLAPVALLGEVEAYLGEFDAAFAYLDRCIKSSGASTQCVFLTNLIHAQHGECEASAQQTLVATTADARGKAELAEAALARGEPFAVVRKIVDQHVTSALKPLQARTLESYAMRLAVVEGDFISAEAAAHRLEKIVAEEPSMQLHAVVAAALADIFIETGRRAEAGVIARNFLETLGAWTPEARVEDTGISRDLVPRLLGVERMAGLISREEMVARRAAWLERWEAKSPTFYRGYLWLQAYAETVNTAEDAEDALAALPGYGGVPPFRPNASVSIGKVYWLAGRVDEAIPLLQGEAQACTALRWPFEHVRASYLLGRALETKGDVGDACTAYQAVLTRWGEAKPRSVTAEDAGGRLRALGCGRSGQGR